MRRIVFGAIAAFTLSTAFAQSKPDALKEEIRAADKALFDAFNRCDIATWRQYLDENVEFYQDNDDVTLTRAALEPSFVERCGKNNVSPLRRELVPETLEVHPIQGYGAVQLGTHRFFVVEPGKPEQLAATPRLVHLWRKGANGRWQITRVISYSH
jgi:ketosteroid isomerase-like protein